MVAIPEYTPIQAAQRTIRKVEAVATGTAIFCIGVAVIIWGVPLPVLVKILTDVAGISFSSISMKLRRRNGTEEIYNQIHEQANRDSVVQQSAHLPAEGNPEVYRNLVRGKDFSPIDI